MKTIILFFSFFILLSSCNDDDSNLQSTKITFTEIAKGGLFGNGAENILQSNLVINNQTDWQNLIDQMNVVNNVSDTFSETTIDFMNITLIAIFLDIKPSGWEVEITSIIENGNAISVTSQEVEADNTVVTQPYYIAKIPKTNEPITFD